MSPNTIVVYAWVTTGVSVVAWPITSLTIFSGEEQGVLALSWIAIILTAVQILLSAYVKKDVDES